MPLINSYSSGSGFGRVLVAWLIGAALATAAAAQTTAPASQPASERLERIDNLLSVILGDNAPEVRLKVARELLLQRWPETTARLADALRQPNNTAAKVAIASALADLDVPDLLDASYVDPLVDLLAADQGDVRAAAARALAAYRDGDVIPRLRGLAIDTTQTPTTRIAALDTLASMTQREAVAALVAALECDPPNVAEAAFRDLQQAVALDFPDLAAARAWWEKNQELSTDAWQQLQIQRLTRRNRDLQRAQAALQDRLIKALGVNYLRAPEAERQTILDGYLADPAAPIRLLGLELLQQQLVEGRAQPANVPDSTRERVRALLTDPVPTVQTAAIRTLSAFRAPEDGPRFLALLAQSTQTPARLALINGLGYVGDATAVPALLDLMNGHDEAVMTETVTALGRLAERGMIDAEASTPVADALLAAAANFTKYPVSLRERLLWAMSNLADPRFAPILAQALAHDDAVAVRQAAIRGLSALNDPDLLPALSTAVEDRDPTVRKAAIEVLTRMGAADPPLDALWRRLDRAQEPDDAIRDAAGRALLELLAALPSNELERRLNERPTASADATPYVADVLSRLAQRFADSQPPARERAAIVRQQLGALQARAGNNAAAIDTYLAALDDAAASQSTRTAAVGLALLHTALRADAYDARVAAALRAQADTIGPEHMREAISSELTPLLTPESAHRALQLADRLAEFPCLAEPEPFLADFRTRARNLLTPASQPAPAETPAPTSAPTSAPAAN